MARENSRKKYLKIPSVTIIVTELFSYALSKWQFYHR